MKKKTKDEISRLVLIANSAYSTHGPFTIDEWFYACEWLRENPQYQIKK